MLPAGSAGEVRENGSAIKKNNKNITFTGMEGNYAVFTINSGHMSFHQEYKPICFSITLPVQTVGV